MPRYFRKFFLVILFFSVLFLTFATNSFAEQFGNYYDTYTPPLPGAKDANSCYYPPPDLCSLTLFDASCNFQPQCADHHCSSSQTGYDCAVQTMSDSQATCISNNYKWDASGHLAGDYTGYCGGGPPWYGFQFYILDPTPTPPPPTPTPACSYTDTDRLGYNETCTGLNGPLSDYCNTSASYQYAYCDNASGCYYGSSTPCPAGQSCRIKSDGRPECYVPCALSDTDGLGYNETCTDGTGTYRDNCGSNQVNQYYCRSDLCTVTATACNVGATCTVQSDGKPVCISPTLTPTPSDII